MKRNNAILCLVLCIVSVHVSAAMTEEKMQSAYTQANEAFSKANNTTDDSDQAQALYQEAIAGYEKIIETGQIHNAMLYYNLANSYLLTENLGKAILNYRRAQRLDSSNPDIYKNLNFARSKCVDQFAVTTQTKILERLFFWHYDLSMKTRFVTGGISLTILCAWLILRIWIVKWPAVIPVTGIMLFAAAAMLVSVAVEQYTLSTYRSGVVVADTVVARQGDSDNYPESFSAPLHAGIEFDVIEQRPGWLHIKLSNGQDTWIPDDSAELI